MLGVGGLEHAAAAEVWARTVDLGWTQKSEPGPGYPKLHCLETGLDFIRLCQRFGFPYYSCILWVYFEYTKVVLFKYFRVSSGANFHACLTAPSDCLCARFAPW